jgi:hypothetical protein
MAGPAPAQDGDFSGFVASLRSDAEARGIARKTFDAAFAELRGPDPDVLARTRRQGEFSRPVWDYLVGAVSPGRIARGQAQGKRLAAHARFDRGEDRRAARGRAGRLGRRVGFRRQRRLPADDPRIGEPRLRPASRQPVSRRVAGRPPDPRERRRGAGADGRFLGRRHGAGAVPALGLSAGGGRFRRRRAARHLALGGRFPRVHRPLPALARLETRLVLGVRGEAAEGFRPDPLSRPPRRLHRPRRAPHRRQTPPGGWRGEPVPAGRTRQPGLSHHRKFRGDPRLQHQRFLCAGDRPSRPTGWPVVRHSPRPGRAAPPASMGRASSVSRRRSPPEGSTPANRTDGPVRSCARR